MKKVVILGARGSIPICRADSMQYGGTTTCILIRIDNDLIVLDAGTGILNLKNYLYDTDNKINLLLSHTHLDHILGLPMCSEVFDNKKQINIYGATRNQLNIKQQLDKLMHLPLWPVSIDKLPAKIDFYDLNKTQMIANIKVDTLEGNHTGGVTLFKFTVADKTIAFITDCTINKQNCNNIAEFAKNCDLLLIDGQYNPEEWEKYKTFGHNTWLDAAKFGVFCGAKKIRIIHHDPDRTDNQLNYFTSKLTNIHKDCAFAKVGEEILL